MSQKIESWEKIDSKEVADCRIFKVREDLTQNSETGVRAKFFVIENPDWVNIIALTKDEQVILIKQYRQGSEEITLEIPGGMIDDGEDPIKCAERELQEETGYTPAKMIYLGKSRPNPAIQSNWIYHFFAKDCEKTENVKFDEHENIITSTVPFAEIKELIETEMITHSLVLAGFYRFDNYLKKENYNYES